MERIRLITWWMNHDEITSAPYQYLVLQGAIFAYGANMASKLDQVLSMILIITFSGCISAQEGR
jgi:hypothetical protein